MPHSLMAGTERKRWRSGLSMHINLPKIIDDIRSMIPAICNLKLSKNVLMWPSHICPSGAGSALRSAFFSNQEDEFNMSSMSPEDTSS